MIIQSQKRSGAFTIIELLVVMAIIGVLMALAATGLGDGGDSQRLTASGNRVMDMVNLARQNAKSRNSMTMLLVVTSGDYAYRSMTILEKPLDATAWKQITAWEVLPDGIGINETKSETFLTQPVASLSPAPPSLSMRGTTLAPNGYAWQVFLPNGQLLSDQATSPVLYLSAQVKGDRATNYYKITINTYTGIPALQRP